MKEKINKLIETYKDDEFVLDMINDTLDLAYNYVLQVNIMETQISVLKFKLEGYDYRMMVQEIDNQRRVTYNALIVSLKALNRFLKSDNREDLKIFDGNIEDRYEVADWAGEISKQIFINRKR